MKIKMLDMTEIFAMARVPFQDFYIFEPNVCILTIHLQKVPFYVMIQVYVVLKRLFIGLSTEPNFQSRFLQETFPQEYF